MPKIVKCTRCRSIHSDNNRVWLKGKDGFDHSCCAKCFCRVTVDVSFSEYSKEVKKQQQHYPALKKEEIFEELVEYAFASGFTPISFLNNIVIERT